MTNVYRELKTAFFGILFGLSMAVQAAEPYLVEPCTISSDIKHVLGYDPLIRVIYKSDPEEVSFDKKHVTLFLHDYAASGNGAFCVKKADLLPGNVVTFDLPDATIKNLPVPVAKFTRSSFGQFNEVLPALVALKHGALQVCKAQAIDLYGLSRGGAVLINLLSVLNQFEKYKPELTSIGLTQSDCNQLLNAVQKGVHVLHCPIKSMRFVKLSMPNWVLQAAIMIGTKYKKNGLDPIKELKNIPKNMNMLVHYQDKDRVVSNKWDGRFFDELSKENAHTFLSLGLEGGHNNSKNLPKDELQETVHSLKKAFNGPHNKKLARLKLAQLLSDKDIKTNDMDGYIKHIFEQKRSGEVITPYDDFKIKPTFTQFGGSLRKKKNTFSKNNYLVDGNALDCNSCANKLAFFDASECLKENTEKLQKFGRTLLNGKHVCE